MSQRISIILFLLFIAHPIEFFAASVPSFSLIPIISGPTSACAGSENYIYMTESGMTDYNWNIASGGFIISGSGTNMITVQWDSEGVHTISVTYALATSPGTLDVTVNETVMPGVVIEASGNPVCSGSQVTFTAAAANGGTSPTYQWKVNGIIVGSNSSTYSYTPADGDEVMTKMTSSAPCANPVTATSNTITMTVSPNLPVAVSITASANPVCMGTVVTYTATPVNGGSSPLYAWLRNGTPVGTNSPTLAYTPMDNDLITCSLTSSLGCASGNPATSNTITMTVTPVLPVAITVSASGNPVCSGNPVTFTAVVLNAGPAPSYQWKVNGNNTGSSNPEMTYIPLNNDVVTCVVTSSATCTMGQTTVSDPLTMTVNPLQPVSLSITVSNNPACQGSEVTFLATPVNGGNSPGYQWRVNGFDAGTNSSSFLYAPANEDVITCQLTSNALCPSGNPALSLPVIMEISPLLPVSVSISPSQNPVCEGSSVTFTAVPINGGNSPLYQWKVNSIQAGSNQSTFTYTPVNSDQVTCKLTSSESCATGSPASSNSITMTVTPAVTPGIVITASENPSCQASQVTYIAAITNGGSAPQYQWYVNGIPSGNSNPSFSTTPSDGDEIICSLTSSLTCVSINPVTSNTILMTVSPVLPVGISIIASDNPVCQGDNVTLTADPENEGSDPTYQWIVNGINVGSNVPQYTFAPSYGDQAACILTSSLSCATGNPAQSTPITLIVNILNPVSVTISASENPSCQGIEVTYTATPVNGGPSPSYQWHANGFDVGNNSPTYTNIPTDGQVITCTLTSNASCVLNTQAISNPVTMDVNPTFLVGITISASDNPVCQGGAVTLSADELNGGPSPVYQWYVNSVPVGINSTIYSYSPANGDTVTCLLTSSLTCTLGNPVLSNEIILSVNSGLPVSVSVTPSANPLCQGDPITFSANVINGGTSPVYQWQLNGTPVGTNNDTLLYSPVNGNIITCEVTSNLLCATSNPATSPPLTMNVNPTLLVTLFISVSENPVCEGMAVTFTASETNGGISPTFQWKVNGINVGTNLNTYSYVPQNGDLIACTMISDVSCPSVNPVTSNLITMNVSNSLPASIQIGASENPFCTGTEVTMTATVNNGGNPPAYQWQLNGINTGNNQNTLTFNPSNGDLVNCILISTASCINGNPFYSDTIELTSTDALQVEIAIDVSANPSCEGMFITFTADPTNGGLDPDYQWQVNGVNAGTNSQSFIYMPLDGDIITCILTSSLSCATSNPATSNAITMDVISGEPVSVSISANPAGTVCTGTEITFTASVNNGGTTPSYQWKVNGVPSGANSSTFSYTPVNGDIVFCIVTSSLTCALSNPAISNPITISVTPFISVGISIAASANPVCTGTWVTFTAIPVNGGSNPLYQWYVNGLPVGDGSNTHIYQPADNDQITCQLTSGLSCTSNNPATSSAIQMAVDDELPVSITIVPLLNPICEGSLIQFTAFPVNKGTSPHYQWKVNGQNTGNNHYIYQYFPANGDQVACVLTSSLACATGNPATSNTINMVAFPSAPVSISITTSSTDVCQNDTATVTAIAINSGTNPIYFWKRNGAAVGTNSPIYRFIPVSGDIIYCMLLSNAQCATGNPSTSNHLTFTVHQPQTVIASILASATTLCEGDPVIFTASVINGGVSPHYQWRVNGADSGTDSPLFSYIPTHGDTVRCEVSSSITCPASNPVLSNSIVLTVSPVLPVGVTISSSSNPACSGIPVTFTATPANGGASPLYQWSVNGIPAGSSASTFVYTPNDLDTVGCELTSSAGCISNNPALSDPLIMSVSSYFPVTISIAASMNPVCLGQTVIYTASATNTGSSPVYQWAVNGINVGLNTATLSHVPSNNDVISCEVTSSYSCATNNPAISNTIIMEAGSELPAYIHITASANPVCEGSLASFSAIPMYGGTNPLFEWKVNGVPVGSNQTNYSYVPVHGDQITCTMTSSYTCATNNPAVSNTVTMLVVTPQPCTATVSPLINPVCEGTPVTVLASVSNGGNNPRFSWMVNGTSAGSNQPFLSYVPANGDSVWCRIVSQNVCTYGDTITSDTVIIHVSTSLVVSLSISTSDNPVCQGESSLFTANAINGGSNPAYQWSVNEVNVGSNAPTYAYFATDEDRITCELTSSITCAVDPDANSDTIIITVNPVLPVSVSITPSANPVCENEPVALTASAVNAGNSPLFEWHVNGVVTSCNLSVYTYTPSDGDTVQCLVWSSDTCISGNPASSNHVIMMVSSIPVQVSLSIYASENPYCAGESVSFTAIAINGGTDPQYTWLVNQVVSGQGEVYTYLPDHEDTVSCIVLSNAACAMGNPASSNNIIMQENPLQPVSVSISATPSDPVCAGSTVVYDASPVNGGVNPSYQWYVNSTALGSNLPHFTYIPENGDTVTVTMTSMIECPLLNPVNSDVIIASVNPNLPVSVAITGDPSLPVCEGSLVTFTATHINGGVNPAYEWQVNGFTTAMGDSSFTNPAHTGDQVVCILTSSETCTSNDPAQSNTITVSTNPLPYISYQACINITSRDAKPFALRGGIPFGGEYLGTGVVNGIFYPATLPPGQDTAYFRYRYTDMNGCTDSIGQTVVVLPAPSFTCGDQFLDIRDHRSYQTIEIGTQCWFRENLTIGIILSADIEPSDNCIVEKYCYGNNLINCLQDGGLYPWNEVMDYQPGEFTQGICPPGWHIPAEIEWMTLFEHFSGMAFAGRELKSDGTSGFDALLPGVNFHHQNWSFQGFAGFFWSSTSCGENKSLSHGFNRYDDGISTYHSLHSNAFSIRCLKD